MLVVENPPANVGETRDMGSISVSERSPCGGHVTHSSILTWRTPWTEEPGRLQPTASQGVKLDWSDLVHCWEPPGCTQSMTRSWDKRGICKAALPHLGLPWRPNRSPPEPWGWERNLQGSSSHWGYPGDKVTGRERNLQGSSSPRGCPWGLVCPFLPSALLLLGFLLIFGNDNI